LDVLFYHFTAILVFLNSCINPFIYAAKYREFQNGVRRMVARVTGNLDPSQSLQASSSIGSRPPASNRVQ